MPIDEGIELLATCNNGFSRLVKTIHNYEDDEGDFPYRYMLQEDPRDYLLRLDDKADLFFMSTLQVQTAYKNRYTQPYSNQELQSWTKQCDLKYNSLKRSYLEIMEINNDE